MGIIDQVGTIATVGITARVAQDAMGMTRRTKRRKKKRR